MTRILGISALYHDSAACLLEDGVIVAAAQEERFTRKKHDSSFPQNAIDSCMEFAGWSLGEIDTVVFYEKPFVKFERLLETYSSHCPRGFRSYLKAMPLWLKEKLWIKDVLRRRLGFEGEILFADHHESHAASAFYPSPFETAAILTVDGVGEWSTTTLGRGQGREIRLERELRFPHSLGLLYSAFTYYLGFRVNSGEYKVMGLAPYGRPIHVDRILTEVIDLSDNGSFRINPEFFNYEVGLEMTSRRFDELWGSPPRHPDTALTSLHKDLAASIQKVTEEALVRMTKHLSRETGEKALCLAGGVALNCVANGRILRESGFQDIWIQPASGDAGGALGSALAAWHRYHRGERLPRPDEDAQQSSLLGPSYPDSEIRARLDRLGAVYSELPFDETLTRAVQVLAGGGVLGWFRGRMEYGPRALGNRSILADPRGDETRDRVNLRIKFRESFRPFAPAIPEERASEYFDLDQPSPYMLLVTSVTQARRSEIPSVVHVDGSARVQTVNRRKHPDFHSLLETFGASTGCPVLLNTSFNVRGEPIVESPENAFRCFMRTGMDALVIGSLFMTKKDQPTGLYDR